MGVALSLIATSGCRHRSPCRDRCRGQPPSRRGPRTIGVYAKTNSDVAELPAGLTERSIDHLLIGFSEAAL
jgi:hypothetical protein